MSYKHKNQIWPTYPFLKKNMQINCFWPNTCIWVLICIGLFQVTKQSISKNSFFRNRVCRNPNKQTQVLHRKLSWRNGLDLALRFTEWKFWSAHYPAKNCMFLYNASAFVHVHVTNSFNRSLFFSSCMIQVVFLFCSIYYMKSLYSLLKYFISIKQMNTVVKKFSKWENNFRFNTQAVMISSVHITKQIFRSTTWNNSHRLYTGLFSRQFYFCYGICMQWN